MKYFNKIISLADKFENKLNKFAQQMGLQAADLQDILKAANFFSAEVNQDVGSMLDKLKVPEGVKVNINIVADAGPKVDYQVTVDYADANKNKDIGSKQAGALRKMLLQKYGQAMVNVLKQNDKTKTISSSVTCGWFNF